MGDQDHRALLQDLLALLDKGQLAARIEHGRGLVEDQDRRVRQQRSGQREPLALAAGQPDALIADQGVVALW